MMTVALCILVGLVIAFILFAVIVVGCADAGFRNREDPTILKKWEEMDKEHLR